MNPEVKQVAAMGKEKCERLLNNPDVEWFLLEAVTRPRNAAEKTLKDLTTGKDDRENAAHVLAALEGVESFLRKQRDIYERQSK